MDIRGKYSSSNTGFCCVLYYNPNMEFILIIFFVEKGKQDKSKPFKVSFVFLLFLIDHNYP